MRKRGFVLSFSTLLIIIILVWFAMFYSGKVARSEMDILRNFSIEKAGFVADDITGDLNKLMGTSVDVNRGENFTVISLGGSLPSAFEISELNDWETFVEGNYASRQNASIGLELGNLTDGTAELIFSNGLQLNQRYNDDENFVRFYKTGGADTGVITYDINVHVIGALYDSGGSDPWDCDTSGDVNVNLRYTDSLGGNVTSVCRQNPTEEYEFEIEFQDSDMELKIEYGDIEGNTNAVKISTDDDDDDAGVTVKLSIRAELPSPAGEIKWYYDADLNYSQADVKVNRKFELGRS